MDSVESEAFGAEKLFSVISGKINHPPIPRLPSIHQITLKTPWRGSTVQVYLIEGNPLTLIDTGVNWKPSFKGLSEAIALLGYKPNQIQRIIGTHFHSDHMGQAQALRELGASIEVLAHEREVDSIEHFFSSYMKKREIRCELYREYGMPDEVLQPQSIIEKNWLQNDPPLLIETRVDRSLRDGDTIDFENFNLRVIHAPGHTEGHVVLFEEESGALFSGDHIMSPEVPFTENFYVSESPDLNDPSRRKPRFQGLREYLDSLDRLRLVPLRVILPGHGEIIDDPQRAIEKSSRFYNIRIKRVQKILETMTATGTMITAWDMWNALYRKVELGGIMRRRMSMLIGIIDILEHRGHCQSQRRDDGVIVHRHV